MMPELPEVETVKRSLDPYLNHQRVEEVVLRRRDLRIPIPDDFETRVTGRVVTSLERRAKYLLLCLDNGDVVIIHLGMSGKFYMLAPGSNAPYQKHDHVIFSLSDRRRVIFNDPRRFGLMTIVKKDELNAHKLIASLGPEPLEDDFNARYLYQWCKRKKISIKPMIMDNKVVVGVGNIYACESLFASNIHPQTPANKITLKQCEVLVPHIKKVLKKAIDAGGSTLKDFAKATGDEGYFQHEFQVYGRENDSCYVCSTPIGRIVQSGRSTFFCPVCQKR